MRTVNIHEAKTHLSRLVDEVYSGEEIIIAKAAPVFANVAALVGQLPLHHRDPFYRLLIAQAKPKIPKLRSRARARAREAGYPTVTLSEQNYCRKIDFRCRAKAQQVEHPTSPRLRWAS